MEHIVEFVTAEDDYASENSFKWDNKSINIYLNAYIERKERFRDPKEKKKLLWREILQVMRAAGYEVEDEDILDRKMRNLKKTYKTVQLNASKSGKGRESISWKYFSTMDDIFACEWPQPSPDSESDIASFSTEPGRSVKVEQTKRRIGIAKPTNSLSLLRRKQLAIERKKLKALEDMHETMKKFLDNRKKSLIEDASGVFGHYVAAKHRQYSGPVKSYFEFEIAKIMFNADTGAFDT
ncbi:uncharacterized protein LOC118752888 [Rhagoletis pomonella]|uniref:uncharacterized protein LOC118752888 n=1 Tax=Rhagoletis pomonella TaxID=28610 RepID=UPI00177AE12C|nr:uncharacterized protein LOC118752888 [Rhagoletis pomonella]